MLEKQMDEGVRQTAAEAAVEAGMQARPVLPASLGHLNLHGLPTPGASPAIEAPLTHGLSAGTLREEASSAEGDKEGDGGGDADGGGDLADGTCRSRSERLVWLPVEDEDAWVVASVNRAAVDGGWMAVRERAPSGVSHTVALDDDALRELLPAAGARAPPVADLTRLEAIHTASVLHELRRRYEAGDIYTAVGPVVLAVNPFAPCDLCSEAHLDWLCARAAAEGAEGAVGMESAEGADAPPHVFEVARSAYSVLVATGGPQAILISGESGAGKTETAKLCLRALAGLSTSRGADEASSGATSGASSDALSTDSSRATAMALQCSLLLEAFGNAKTVHNENSSRFGKWLEVHFEPPGYALGGCAVRSFLLELSRVVGQAPGERNYHIFYQVSERARERTRPAHSRTRAGTCTCLPALSHPRVHSASRSHSLRASWVCAVRS